MHPLEGDSLLCRQQYPSGPSVTAHRGAPLPPCSRALGKPKGRWVREEGGSEGRSVMDRIGVERTGDIAPGESRKTSLWAFVTRESWLTDSGRQADMSAAATLAGAAPEVDSGWHA